jgi:argininosuccinate lyase
VATALRLFLIDEIRVVISDVTALQRTLERRAVEAQDAYMPGYTHMQRAQPVLVAHYLLAHGWALARDVDRLFATWTRLDVSPLGAGALAGSSLGRNRPAPPLQVVKRPDGSRWLPSLASALVSRTRSTP